MHAPADWYKTFFNGLVVDMWLSAMPAETTASEAEFLRARLQAPVGGRLLDVPCGGGRHSIALAANGYSMTSVDISPAFLDAARAKSAGLSIDWQLREMVDLPWADTFDGAFCFGNSLGYLPDADNARFLQAVARTLKPGARFVLDYGAILEALLSTFMPRGSHQLGDIFYERNGIYDPATGRIVVEHSMTREGRTEKNVMSQRAYTYREVCELFTAAGFVEMQGYGGFNDEPFGLGSKRLVLVATRK